MPNEARYAAKAARTAGSAGVLTLRTYGREALEGARIRIALLPYAGLVIENTMKANSTFFGLFATISKRSTSTPSTTPERKRERKGA